MTDNIKRYIYDLENDLLVLRMVELDVKLLPPCLFHGFNEKPVLNDWERSFIANIQTFWTGRGFVTWKQRRVMRKLLLAVCMREARRQEIQQGRMAVVSNGCG